MAVTSSSWDRSFTIRDAPMVITQRDGLGLGGSIWDPALTLIHYLNRADQFPGAYFSGKRIVEIGSGTGVCGIVFARLGGHVTITDVAGHISLIQHNVDHNCKALPVIVAEHYWGTDQSSLKPPFDIVVASDVIYDPRNFDQLIDTITGFSDEKTQLYLAYEKRSPNDVGFFDKIKKYWTLVRVPASQLDETYQSDDITIFIGTRTATPFVNTLAATTDALPSAAVASAVAAAAPIMITPTPASAAPAETTITASSSASS